MAINGRDICLPNIQSGWNESGKCNVATNVGDIFPLQAWNENGKCDMD